MQRTRDFKQLYWLIIFSLLFLPLTNSFIVSVKKLVKSIITYNGYKNMVKGLTSENNNLANKVKYYESSQGLKNLIKERLNKVEEGELLIKIDH